MATIALNIICCAQIVHHVTRWVPLTHELMEERRQKRMVHHLNWNRRQHRPNIR